MTPMLGIMASQISGHLTPLTGFVSIATTTLSSNQSTITFSAIPQVYKHLQIRAVHQSTTASWTNLSLNSDTTASNYAMHRLSGDGATAFSEAYVSSNQRRFFTSYPSPYWCSSVIDILDYTNTNKNTTVRGLHSWAGNNASGFNGEVNFISNLWLNTAAVSTIDITIPGQNFTTYSTFALYGIEG
jgi:hypothetical protein